MRQATADADSRPAAPTLVSESDTTRARDGVTCLVALRVSTTMSVPSTIACQSMPRWSVTMTTASAESSDEASSGTLRWTWPIR